MSNKRERGRRWARGQKDKRGKERTRRKKRGGKEAREGRKRSGAEGESKRARGHSVIQSGKAKPVKMFADVSWEKTSFYRSPDGSNVIDRPAGLMNGRSSDGAVARRTVKPIVGLF